MSMCEAVSDRMPAVAAGRGDWTAEEREHLASCGECAAEWGLVVSARRIGRDVNLDVAGTTARVLEQLRAARAKDLRRRWTRRAATVGVLAIAATLLLVLMPRRRQVQPVQPGASVAIANQGELQLAELDDAAPAELEMVLAEFDGPAVPASSLDGPDLEGLDQSQVERALRSWEES